MKIQSPVDTSGGGSPSKKKEGGVRQHAINILSLFIAVYFTFTLIQQKVAEQGGIWSSHPVITVLASAVPLYIVWMIVAKLLDMLLERQGY